MAGMISPEDHQTGQTRLMTGQKEPHQEARQPSKPIGTSRPQKKATNVQATGKHHQIEDHHLHLIEGRMLTKANTKAVLPVAKRKALHQRSHTAAALQLAIAEDRQAAANHIQAG